MAALYRHRKILSTTVPFRSVPQARLAPGLSQVRLAAAHAVAKIAVRSGEPFRLQGYAILAACRQVDLPGLSRVWVCSVRQ